MELWIEYSHEKKDKCARAHVYVCVFPPIQSPYDLFFTNGLSLSGLRIHTYKIQCTMSPTQHRF